MSTVDLFNLFDVDKSGGITSDEIQKGFSKIGFFYSPEKIKAFINTFDSDDNGILTMDEFTELNDKINSDTVSADVDKLFAEIDDNEDGILTVDELRTAWSRLSDKPPDHQHVQSFLDTVDDDNDGMVSKEEFTRNPIVRIAVAIMALA